MSVEIAVIADIQVGHEAALWPIDYTDVNGKQIKPTKAQVVLNQYWDDFFSSEEVKNCDTIINLSESIEGNNRKSSGRSLVEVDIILQEDAFVKLLKDKIVGKNYYGVEGSAYHTSIDYNVEANIAKRLGGTFCGAIANLKLAKTGHSIYATHKGGDAMLYRSTMLDRNSLYFSAIKSKIGIDPDIILFGHHHKYFRVDTESRINLIAPTWKFWHPIKGAAGFPYTQPTIGGLVIRFGDNKGHIEVITKFYKLEHIYSAVREI
jgi:hypothetical protein